MDVTDDVIRSDPHPRRLAALRVVVAVLTLVVGWFILSAVFGGTAAHAASEAEPEAADASLLGTLSSVVSGVTDPQAPGLPGLGADVAEPLDAVVSTLPIVPEIVGETPVDRVTSPVLHATERILMVVPEIADAAALDLSGSVAPVAAPTVVADSTVVSPPPVATSFSSAVTAPVRAASSPADAGTSPAVSSLPLTPDQPTPVTGTTTTGASAGSAGATTAGDLCGVGWSPLSEGAELPPADSDRCPASATYDSDSTPD